MAIRLKHYIEEAYQFSKKNNLSVIYEIYFYFRYNFMICCYLEKIGIDKLQIIKILVKFTTSYNFYMISKKFKSLIKNFIDIILEMKFINLIIFRINLISIKNILYTCFKYSQSKNIYLVNSKIQK